MGKEHGEVIEGEGAGQISKMNPGGEQRSAKRDATWLPPARMVAAADRHWNKNWSGHTLFLRPCVGD